MSPAERPAPGSSAQSPPRHWFEDIADHVGPAYLRYSFTKGTDQEVGFLVDELGLEAGMTVLDVGCGPGRHAIALAKRGIRVRGLDISSGFIEIARRTASDEGVTDLVDFQHADARAMQGDARFEAMGADAAISLCQGAFGLGGPPDEHDPQNLAPDSAVLNGILGALAPGGRCAVSAFSSYFQVRYLENSDDFSASSAVNHENTEILDPDGLAARADLWTTCYTPRELRLLAERVGLVVDHISSVTPGGYRRTDPDIDSHEFLLLAHRA